MPLKPWSCFFTVLKPCRARTTNHFTRMACTPQLGKGLSLPRYVLVDTSGLGGLGSSVSFIMTLAMELLVNGRLCI
jgi:hypothetical protein